MNEVFKNLQKAKETLLNLREPSGDWAGELSSSAVSTSTAAYALQLADEKRFSEEILGALTWLKNTQLPDGSWGDTPESKGNLSATILSLAALNKYKNDDDFAEVYLFAKKYLAQFLDFSSAKKFSKSVLKYYGKDLTFSAPILAMCASSGLLEAQNPWGFVPRLPFEFAAFPNAFFAFLRLPVVSYAIPALVCVGFAKAAHSGFFSRFTKRILEKKLLSKILKMQPSSGGFLEATPLTSFCAICLKAASLQESQVFKNAIKFILKERRQDSSFPIDTNLSQWLTSLSSSALADFLSASEKENLSSIILSRQLKTTHSFTGAKAGAWAWIPTDGGVPDADDTAAALCALFELSGDKKFLPQIKNGLEWLMNLQNSDGGMPTFCKGWSRMPFDKSCADITAHAHKAFSLWEDFADDAFKSKMQNCIVGFEKFLERSQNLDGSWLTLWFGDQDCQEGVAPTYATAIVLEHLGANVSQKIYAKKGAKFLCDTQNADGAWGGGRNVKSKKIITARVLSALCNYPEHKSEILKGLEGFRKFHGNCDDAIGLYFSKLWYSEKLYSPIFELNAYKAISKLFANET